VNPTIEKFGYPATQVREYEHWLVLLRPAQVTLGSLVLAAKSDGTAFSALPRAAFAEQADVIAAIERALTAFTGYERINYLMLMMVDPNVHFHVIPRYSEPRLERPRVSRRWLARPAAARQRGHSRSTAARQAGKRGHHQLPITPAAIAISVSYLRRTLRGRIVLDGRDTAWRVAARSRPPKRCPCGRR
jgi:diadenosine tetraphosphate (Ap4A) HIT family hydrolase